jgi:hypothetical protein
MSSPLRRAAKRRQITLAKATDVPRMKEWIRTVNRVTFFCWVDDKDRRHTTATHPDQDHLEGAAKVLRLSGWRVTVEPCKTDAALFALNGVIDADKAKLLEPAPAEGSVTLTPTEQAMLDELVAKDAKEERATDIGRTREELLKEGYQPVTDEEADKALARALGETVGPYADPKAAPDAEYKTGGVAKDSTPPPGFRVSEDGLVPEEPN